MIAAWVLNLAYLSALVLLTPWLVWRSVRTGRYRQGWAAKWWGRVDFQRSDQPRVVWLHAVSVGEVNLLETLIHRLERQDPDCVCVISTTTDTGYKVARQRYAPRAVFYCPLDFSWAVNRAMRRVRPDLLVLAELELWPNLIHSAVRKGAKVAIVNARLSERSARGYQRIRWVMSRLLRRIDLIAAQSDETAERFIGLGAAVESTLVTGSVKFDGACVDRRNDRTEALSQWAGYQSTDCLWLAGSTQAPEEQLAIDAFLRLRESYPQLRLALAPRHPERSDEVRELLRSADLEFVCRSQPHSIGDGIGDRVLLIDVVGELGAWWGRADIAYVGGSMGSRGGQNMIEPAAYGCPVSFGPKTRNFRDVVSMLRAANAAVVVEDGAAMQQFVQQCMDDDSMAELGRRARELVQRQQGAADRTVTALLALLPRKERAKAA